MPDPLLIAAGNPYDLTVTDLEELADEIRATTNIEVEVRTAEERGAGVTLWEVVRIWLPDQQLVEDAMYAGLIAAVGRWFNRRFRTPEGNKRKKSVTIYGPDGQPLRRVTVETHGADLQDEPATGDELPHEPPE